MPADPSWYLLVHQLPPRPFYLRAKVRQRLARLGAVALKNSVYVLPARAECLEDLQWVAQEAEAGGGESHICEARFVQGVTAAALTARFRRERTADYAALASELRRLPAAARRRGRHGTDALARARRRLEEVRAVDFFEAPGRKEAESMLRTIEARIKGARSPGGPQANRAGMAGKTWVTRRDVHVDRMATAWLVRRFLDPRARFRFLEPAAAARPRAGHVRFDVVGGDFTHEGDRCTFEVLLRRTGLRDRALQSIAEIVHDLDLKDARFGRPEAPGVQRVLQGIVLTVADDADRLAPAFSLFDGLYASLKSAPGRGRRRKGRPRG